MKISVVLLIGLVCLTAGGEIRARSFKPDLRTPGIKLNELVTAAKGTNLLKVLELVVNFLSNCLPGLIDLLPKPPTTTTIPPVLVRASACDPKIMDTLIPMTLADDIKGYMSSPDFEEIHNHLWNNNVEWVDTIKLLYDAGWNENYPGDSTTIYQLFQQFYDQFECKLPLPTGPPPAAIRSQIQGVSVISARNGTLGLPPPFIDVLELFQAKADLADCNVTELLAMLVESKLIPFVNLVLFVVEEVNTDASVHLLWATFTEPAKGPAFRELRTLAAFKKLVNHWDSQLKQNQGFQCILEVLGGFTGIDFGGLNINVVSNLISIFEFFVWGTPFIVPT